MSDYQDSEQIPPKELESPPIKHNSPHKGLEAIPNKPKKRKIDTETVRGIAGMVAKGLTEREACARLDIREGQWHTWKQRHKDKFEQTFTRIRANRIDNLLGSIETAAQGDADRGIRMDWRAAHALLGITDSRFAANKQAETEQKSPIFAVISSDVAASVFQKLLPEPEKMKQLPQVVDIK